MIDGIFRMWLQNEQPEHQALPGMVQAESLNSGRTEDGFFRCSHKQAEQRK